VQQPVSCSSAYGNNGCNGGWYYWVWEWMQVTPVVQAIYYPYSSGAGVTGTCATITNATAPFASTVATGTPYVQVGTTNAAIQSAIMVKPVSVAVEANLPAFQLYSSGVITKNCGTFVDHAILAVGWGNDPTYGNYWIVENSWGSSWGANGYVLIGMSDTSTAGICGINQYVYYPLTA